MLKNFRENVNRSVFITFLPVRLVECINKWVLGNLIDVSFSLIWMSTTLRIFC